MSVAELKLLAIERITQTEDVALLETVMQHLQGVAPASEAIPVDEEYERIKNRYGAVLKKLAE